MAILNLALTFLLGLGVVIAGIILRTYLPTYFSEKAKNLARKEDVEHLTRAVELVKNEFTAETERLKAGLDRATHASKLQFDAEFGIYREIWDKLVGMRGAFFALRPSSPRFYLLRPIRNAQIAVSKHLIPPTMNFEFQYIATSPSTAKRSTMLYPLWWKCALMRHSIIKTQPQRTIGSLLVKTETTF